MVLLGAGGAALVICCIVIHPGKHLVLVREVIWFIIVQ